jgi:hypothetical protein
MRNAFAIVLEGENACVVADAYDNSRKPQHF